LLARVRPKWVGLVNGYKLADMLKL